MVKATLQYRRTQGRRWTGWGLAPVVGVLFVLWAFPHDSGATTPPPDDAGNLDAQYRRVIQPDPVDAGSRGAIFEGAVILYGQWVEPPYEFSIRDRTLLLNGVRIDPPILPPWKRHPERISPSEAGLRISELAGRIRSVHRDMIVEKESDVRESLRRYVSRAEPTVAAAEWIDSETLHLALVGGAEFSIGFRNLEAPADPAETRADILRAAADRYERGLQAGALLVIGCGPVLTVPQPLRGETRRRIEEALLERSSKKLVAALHHEELAREMAFLAAVPMEEE